MPHTIALLGYGRFGRAFADRLADTGIEHRVFDPGADVPKEKRSESLQSLVEGAVFVVLAVPVTTMHAALESLRPYLRPTQIVFDVCSVKVKPCADMAQVLGKEIPWVGTHPLFGPLSLALAERPLRVVLCESLAHPAAAGGVRALYERIGCEVIGQTPENHDQVMAHTHALTFFVAKGMIDAGVGMSVPFAPPSFQAISRALDTVRSDAGHLFLAIQRDNPYAAEARRQLVSALSGIDRALVDASDPGARPDAAQFSIPDLGSHSPDLLEARDLIDELDREVVQLLARRSELVQRAAKAKAAVGAPVLDAAREGALFAARRAWAAELGADADSVDEVFRAIVRMSRRVQR